MYNNISYILPKDLYETNQRESNSKLAKENCDPRFIMHGIHYRSGLQCQKRIWAWKEVLGISLRCEWLTQSFWEEWKIIYRWSNVMPLLDKLILNFSNFGDQVYWKPIQHLSNPIMIRNFETRRKTTSQRNQIRVLFSEVCPPSWCAKAG